MPNPHPPLPATTNSTFLDTLILTKFKKDYVQFIGPYFFCDVVDFFFEGMIICLIVEYFKKFSGDRKDRVWLRSVVIVVGIISIIQTGLRLGFSWVIWVIHYGEPSYLTLGKFTWPHLLIWTIQCFIVQSFYIHKAFLLHNKSYWVLGGCSVLAVVSLGSSVWGLKYWMSVFSILQFQGDTFKHLTISSYVSIWGYLASDLAITVTIIVGLYKIRTGWSRTDKVLQRMVGVTFEAAIPPCAWAAVVAFHYTITNELTILKPYIDTSGKVYTICLLFTLNQRTMLRGVLNDTEQTYHSRSEESHGLSWIKNRGKHSSKEEGSTKDVEAQSDPYIRVNDVQPEIRFAEHRHLGPVIDVLANRGTEDTHGRWEQRSRL